MLGIVWVCMYSAGQRHSGAKERDREREREKENKQCTRYIETNTEHITEEGSSNACEDLQETWQPF